MGDGILIQLMALIKKGKEPFPRVILQAVYHNTVLILLSSITEQINLSF